jgi:hypothetical protein
VKYKNINENIIKIGIYMIRRRMQEGWSVLTLFLRTEDKSDVLVKMTIDVAFWMNATVVVRTNNNNLIVKLKSLTVSIIQQHHHIYISTIGFLIRYTTIRLYKIYN